MILPWLAVYGVEPGILRGYAVLIDPLEINVQNQSIITSAVNSMSESTTKDRGLERTFAGIDRKSVHQDQ